MVYRIYRMKDSARQQFRWAPHTIGVSMVKVKDYEPIETTEAASPYALWIRLNESGTPLQVGDVLESESGELRIYKYVGFEQAQWQVPEVKSHLESTAAGAACLEPSS